MRAAAKGSLTVHNEILGGIAGELNAKSDFSFDEID